MYVIRENVEDEIVIKNSRFICLLYRIDKLEDVKAFIMATKEKYKEATHYCYAYILGDKKKADDDGEPSGTAGIPLLKVIDSNNMENILVVVVRYFGGIKLGAAGLIRAYSKCLAKTIKKAKLNELIEGYDIIITFSYNDIKKMDYYLKDMTIIKKEFNDIVRYEVLIPTSFKNDLDKRLINYEIVKETMIEKIV